MRGRPLVVLALALAALTAGCGTGRTAEHQRTPAAERLGKALQAKLDAKRSEHDVVGITAAVAFADGTLWAGASGLADKDPERSLRPDTPMAIASVTKPLVGALAVALAKEGRLSLDDPLSTWVPSFPNARTITVRQLLNHTSGLFDVDENEAFNAAIDGDRSRAWTPHMVLRYARRPYAPPGRSWRYSDTNYTLAGLVLRRASGSSVSRALHRLVLDRHGLRSAALQPEEPAPAGTARGFPPTADTFPAPGRYVPFRSRASTEWTAGGMVANAPELATWGRALFAGRVVGPDGLREMLRTVPASDVGYTAYGLGLARRHIVERDVMGASGRFPGYASDLWHDPKTRATVAVLWNDTLLLRSTDVADTLLEVVRGSQ